MIPVVGSHKGKNHVVQFMCVSQLVVADSETGASFYTDGDRLVLHSNVPDLSIIT